MGRADGVLSRPRFVHVSETLTSVGTLGSDSRFSRTASIPIERPWATPARLAPPSKRNGPFASVTNLQARELIQSRQAFGEREPRLNPPAARRQSCSCAQLGEKFEHSVHIPQAVAECQRARPISQVKQSLNDRL